MRLHQLSNWAYAFDMSLYCVSSTVPRNVTKS